MDYLVLYNREGRAVAWVSDDQDYPAVFLFDGTPVAWISGDDVYDYSGKHLGWIQDGWIWDPEGFAAFFTPAAHGGPSRPSRQPRPVREPRDSRPLREPREPRLPRSVRLNSWSTRSDESFFAH